MVLEVMQKERYQSQINLEPFVIQRSALLLILIFKFIHLQKRLFYQNVPQQNRLPTWIYG